ncbi:Uncharacterised protein [Actinomyces naeslundii]|uniref:Flp family type IVb pilin n=1 Tax=Actinomyces naeslundii TaxID=1655 RepID=UPI001A51E996|nr:hypothetical protein [Actinomyces naeslundii]VTX91594.1 Uncharacterised protein [Actinomyces naeslundii]
MNNNALLRLQVRLQQAWVNLRDSERGQTMVEYAGIALIVAAIIGAVIGVAEASGAKLGQSVTSKIAEAIDKMH